MERKRKSGLSVPVERVFHAQVLKELGTVMEARGLKLVSGGPEGLATLAARRCWVKLQLEADGTVTCCLYDVNGGGLYELDGYLLLFGEQNLQNSRNLGWIAEVLGSRIMDGPLAGDFSWGKDYWLLVEELLTVVEELVPVLRRGRGRGH